MNVNIQLRKKLLFFTLFAIAIFQPEITRREVAEVTDGNELEMKTDLMPYWFKTALWDKFGGEAVVV